MQAICDRQVKGRRFLAFGSFTWAAASVKLLNSMAEEGGFVLLGEGVTFKQGFSAEKFDAEALAALV